MADNAHPPVLPWARTDAPSGSSPALEAPNFNPRLAPGQRVEVRWQVTDEESGKTTTQWWGATIAQQQQPEEAPTVWKLRYDASEDFEEEDADVRFLCERYLKNLEDSAVLRWKMEGTPLEEDEEDEADDFGEETVVLGEITAACEEMEREMGQTVEEAALQELGTLEPFQQRLLITGFTDYLNTVKTQLRQIVDRNDENYVVTEEDVQQIVQSAKRNKTA